MDYAYFILGAEDELNLDGSRDREDVRGCNYSEKRFRDILDSRYTPPIPLAYTEVEVDGSVYGVISIPPSRHVHYPTRNLDTPKGGWRKNEVRTRYGDEVQVAHYREIAGCPTFRVFRYVDSAASNPRHRPAVIKT
jgi:hypothetical protein